MHFVTAIERALGENAGPDELLTTAQSLYDGISDPVSVLRGLEAARMRLGGISGGKIPGGIPGGGDARDVAVQLMMLEIRLYLADPPTENEFKALAFLSPANSTSAQITALMRIKYQDLVTDHQFLLSPACKYLRLMDLVPKKINALSLAKATNAVVENVQMKVLVYYLLGDSDFRDKSVLRYVRQEKLEQRFRATAIERFMAYKERLLPYERFCGLVEYVQQFYSFRKVFAVFRVQLTENYLDSNLSKLPRYFRSIRIRRIEALFMPDASDIDVEGVIARMIINNKFPAGSSIDQIHGAVYFGEPAEKYDGFNTHVKKICDLVQTLSG